MKYDRVAMARFLYLNRSWPGLLFTIWKDMRSVPQFDMMRGWFQTGYAGVIDMQTGKEYAPINRN